MKNKKPKQFSITLVETGEPIKVIFNNGEIVTHKYELAINYQLSQEQIKNITEAIKNTLLDEDKEPVFGPPPPIL